VLTSIPLLSKIVMMSSWPSRAANVSGVLPHESFTCKFASPSSSADKPSLSLLQIRENIERSLLDLLCKDIAVAKA